MTASDASLHSNDDVPVLVLAPSRDSNESMSHTEVPTVPQYGDSSI